MSEGGQAGFASRISSVMADDVISGQQGESLRPGAPYTVPGFLPQGPLGHEESPEKKQTLVS